MCVQVHIHMTLFHLKVHQRSIYIFVPHPSLSLSHPTPLHYSSHHFTSNTFEQRALRALQTIPINSSNYYSYSLGFTMKVPINISPRSVSFPSLPFHIHILYIRTYPTHTLLSALSNSLSVCFLSDQQHTALQGGDKVSSSSSSLHPLHLSTLPPHHGTHHPSACGDQTGEGEMHHSRRGR